MKKEITAYEPEKGTTGYRIRKYRLLRNISQQELGLRCGFPEKSANVRVHQYENNNQLPRDKDYLLKTIAKALELDESAIFDLDLTKQGLIYHLLFELEDVCQISPYIINDVCYIRFLHSPKMDNFIKEWAETKDKYAIQHGDSKETKMYKKQQYEIWKGEFPKHSQKELDEEIKMARKKDIQDRIEALQKELENL